MGRTACRYGTTRKFRSKLFVWTLSANQYDAATERRGYRWAAAEQADIPSLNGNICLAVKASGPTRISIEAIDAPTRYLFHPA